MARCKSWRPLPGSSHSAEKGPGGRARLWKPCRRKVPKGRTRCEECEDALLTHPDPVVRRWLAEEPGQDPAVLEVLAGDLDPAVSAAALSGINASGRG